MGELQPVTDGVSEQGRRLAEALRELFAGLGVSVRRYGARRHRDPGTVSGYLSGRQIPPWEFVTDLVHDVAAHRGVAGTPTTLNLLRELHREALRCSGSPLHAVQVLQDQLADADRDARLAAQREQVLTEALLIRQHRIADLEVRLRDTEAAWERERAEARREVMRRETSYAEMEAERAYLKAEVRRLTADLTAARESHLLAEERCAHLERQLAAVEGPAAERQATENPPGQPSTAPARERPATPAGAEAAAESPTEPSAHPSAHPSTEPSTESAAEPTAEPAGPPSADSSGEPPAEPSVPSVPARRRGSGRTPAAARGGAEGGAGLLAGPAAGGGVAGGPVDRSVDQPVDQLGGGAAGAPTTAEPEEEAAPAKVLLVDDRPENLLALEAILEDVGVQLVSVSSGEEALKALLTEDFALILLDVQMPLMDGFETAAYIQQRERTRGIPLIFLTASSHEPEQAVRGYESGAADYILKPFDPYVLRAKVRAFVGSYQRHHAVGRAGGGHRVRERLG
ncbi:CheY-like chemotaxis protein [Allostreptomyces psammosilenae]|uniref:CheY-like chemotaxis protein n=1 Tax=Allostreptomyces psammosilenae TaxID=1892865 RepID=A0A853A402_9ACTN|nr:CheY-like chemotaxis protein [Allostreptomyces psammosilenae]